MPDPNCSDTTGTDTKGTDTMNIDPARIHSLTDRPAGKLPGNTSGNKNYVIYWMQQSQRALWNHALEFAVCRANFHGCPLMAVFCLTNTFPEANLRHYTFMAEGLCETGRELEKRGIRFVLRAGNPGQIVPDLAEQAKEIICDRGYTRVQRQWQQHVAEGARCPVFCVESDVVVPAETASQKAEYAARTIRPKILAHLDRFVRPVAEIPLENPATDLEMRGLAFSDPQKMLSCIQVDGSVSPVTRFFKGGTREAIGRFDDFLDNRIARYIQNSNQPQTDDISRMSPYLHFGQISPVYLAWKVQNRKNLDPEIKTAFIEELVVRRELAVNFVWFTKNYDAFSCLPDWAKKTLADHAKDPRKYRYSIEALDAAATHDIYWNAAMDEMKSTGFMHNYMRMYWGKKILEWSKSPETAFKNAIVLNNKYFLDGRDPNSFAGVAWIFGLHDRAWKARDIFGKVRYMNAAGLERKCDIKAYVDKIEQIKTQQA